MSEDLVERLSAPHGYFGRTLRHQAAEEIRRLRKLLSDTNGWYAECIGAREDHRIEAATLRLENEKLRRRIEGDG